jgi:hypothetical protein
MSPAEQPETMLVLSPPYTGISFNVTSNDSDITREPLYNGETWDV